MRALLLLFLLLTSSYSFSQGEANNWYFGNFGGLSFNTTPPTPLTDGRLNTLEGCTSISDATGQLQFYTDGITVWNRNHQTMFNGTGLKGDPSSTSSGLIVPQPNTPNSYFIFTVDEPHHSNADNDSGTIDGDGINDGFMYSVVDMTLDGGNGGVVAGQKNIPLITYDTSNAQESAYRCSEKITAVKSDNCDSFWVITHFVDRFYSFEVDATGVNATPVISQVGVAIPTSGYRRNALGYIKASPQGDKLAVAHLGLSTITAGEGPGKVLLYDFDNVTGTVSNEIELYDGDSPYGVEFSQSGQRLYATIGEGDDGRGNGFIIQYDVSLPEAQIAASGTRLVNENGQDSRPFSAGAIQLGPDGRIYRALYDFNNGFGDYIGVIENPEEIAANVIYRDEGILVNTDGNRASRIGLPPFIQSIFAQTIDIINNGILNDVNLNLCEGETYRLFYTDIGTATYTWYLDDVQIVNTGPFLDITTSGNYRLEVDLNDGSCPLIGVANVTFFEVPVVQTAPLNQDVCDPNNDAIVDIDINTFTNDILGLQDPATFQVQYYRTQTDADTRVNPILISPFTTENNPQTIVARIENTGNTDCYDTTSFLINIFNTPTAFEANPIVQCDNADDGDDSNGQINYDLTQLSPQIYNGQSAAEFEISYHTTLLGAQNNTDIIATPNNANLSNASASVFVRIQNIANPDCFDVVEVFVTINLLPTAVASTLFQCDAFNDTNDGITRFNLEEANASITAGVSGVSNQFFLDQVSADAGVSSITNVTDFENTQNPQTIFVRVTNDVTGCYRTTTLELNVSTTNASDTDLHACDDDGLEDGFRLFTLSEADAGILAGIGTANLSVSYYETQINALNELNPITTFTNPTSGSQGQDIVYARVEDNINRCFGINIVRLFIDVLPDIEEENSLFLCQNETNVEINAGLQSGNPTDFSYLWSTGETLETIAVTQPGSYTVTVTNTQTGCQKNRNIEVIASGAATIQSIEISDGSSDNTVTILADGPGDYEYAIETDGVLSFYQDSPTFTNIPPGFHTVYIRDKNDCDPLTTEDIAVIGFPKYFTPNNDSFHDTWNVDGVSGEFIAGTLIYIFDRYGKLLKQVIPNGLGWDGTFNGQNMPSADYWYRVELSDGRILKGNFTLKR